MNKKLLTILLIPLFITGCNKGDTSSSSTTGDDVSGSTVDVDISDDTISSTFSLVNDDTSSAISGSNGVYIISSAGNYTASGKLENGQIYVNVGDDDDVELTLDDVSISNSSVSPIFVNNCSDFDIKVKKKTTNYIYDNRSTDYSSSSDDTVGKGAIYVADGDLKIKGQGTLSVVSLANSGIHGKDNVTVKNVTMLIKAVNNGIRGNDKVTIEEGPTLGIVAGNNGIRTSNSDVSSSGNQRGYIYINGGTITINSYGDGIDAAYAVSVGTSTDSDSVTYTPTIDIYTNIYSSYSYSEVTSGRIMRGGPGGNPGGQGGGFNGGGMNGGSSAEKADDSAKAIKANEAIDITAGEIFTYTYDDGLHTNNEDKLDSGKSPNANINISGGSLKMKASDDAIHADGTLNITGGTIYISESHEGLEGNKINIVGGNITVFADDDGVNASNSITVSAGYLDVTVNPNGDTDGIDSNGTYTQSGGIVITRGPNNQNSSALDADGSKSISGGTIIILGYGSISRGSGVNSYSLSLHSSGSHTVKINGTSYTFTNSYSYGQTLCYSSVSVSA